VGKTSGVIDINGTDYDIATGRVVGAVKRMAGQVKMPSSSQVIDGFIKSKQPAKDSSAVTAKPIKKVRSKKASRQAAKVGASAVHHRTQHSKTLLR
jgi:hypothetical protein